MPTPMIDDACRPLATDHEAEPHGFGALDDRTIVDVASIRTGDSPRLGGYDLGHARALAETWNDLPPILVDAETMTVIDGYHRLVASRLRGDRTIEVELFHGTPSAIYAEAVRRNIAHGKPLSVAEREAAATRLLELEPTWSCRRVAVLCGLSDKTVAAVRARMTASHPQLRDVSHRVGADGRARPTDPVALRHRIADAVHAAPSASAREIAAAVGASQATVLDVRRRLAAGGSPVPESLARRAGSSPPSPEAANRASASTDRAIAAVSGGTGFAEWLDTSDIHDADWEAVVDILPLSRLYELADEARRRATCWRSMADRLEARTRRPR